jgi:hypothetical protein
MTPARRKLVDFEKYTVLRATHLNDRLANEIVYAVKGGWFQGSEHSSPVRVGETEEVAVADAQNALECWRHGAR